MTSADTIVQGGFHNKPAKSQPPALELSGINKWFGANHANKDVSLTVRRGSIHGVIGENGAGKSTIMSIVYGYLRADSGTVQVNGKPTDIRTPRDAIAAGIGMVHQHFMLVDTFTVVENVLLGAEGGAMLAPGFARARKELERLEHEYALEVNVDAIVGDLPVGLQQRVEILKALYRGADILILDEPTGVLTPQEADHLFRILRALRDQGKTIIIITHKLREIMDLTDTVTVMRRGEVVANVETASTSRDQLAELMVGRKVLLRVDKKPAEPGPVVLDVRALKVVDGSGVLRVKEVSLTVRRARSSASPGFPATASRNCWKRWPASSPSLADRSACMARRSPADRSSTPATCAGPGSRMCPRTARRSASSPRSPPANARSWAITTTPATTAAS